MALIEQIIRVPNLTSILPDYVRCKVCGGRPEGLNWLKPVSPDPACKAFIHIHTCVKKDV